MTKSNSGALKTAYLKYFLSIAVSLLILFVLIAKIPLEQIIAVLRRSRIDFFILAVLSGALSIFICALRWQLLLRYLGYRYDLRFLSKLSFMALFFNVYLPGGIGGDIARVAILPDEKGSQDKKGSHLTKITASVVTDRVVGMIGLMLLAFAGFIFCYRLLLDSGILLIFGLITLGIIALFVILFSVRVQSLVKKIFAFPLRIFSPIKATLKELTDALYVYRENYSVFGKVIPLSILAHLCVVSYFFLASRSIGLDISFLKLLAFVPVVEFVAAIPISLGGAGIREVATISLFSSVSIPPAEAMSVSLLSFAVILLLGAAGGILFLRRRKDKK